jgi:hypothetical protein
MDGAILLTYGRSKTGKTTDAICTVPDGLFLTPAPGGLAPSLMLTGGLPIREERVNSIRRATAIVKKPETPRWLVIDDFSILAERSQVQHEANGLGGWDLWGALKNDVQQLREAVLARKAILILTCHENGPAVKDGKGFVPGAPRMPSRAMTEAMPHVANLVLHVVMEGFATDSPWTGRYKVDPTDNQWITGDRYAVMPTATHMSLREMLKWAKAWGHDVPIPPRPAALTWMDDAIEKLSAAIRNPQAGLTSPEAIGQALRGAFPNADPRHLRWVHHDAAAHAHLRTKGVGLNLNLYGPAVGS